MDGRVFYQVKWAGWNRRYNSWEHEDHISQQCINEYEKQLQRKNENVQTSKKSDVKPYFPEIDKIEDDVEMQQMMHEFKISYIPASLSLLRKCQPNDKLREIVDPDIEEKIDSCKKNSNVKHYYERTCGMYVFQ